MSPDDEDFIYMIAYFVFLVVLCVIGSLLIGVSI